MLRAPLLYDQVIDGAIDHARKELPMMPPIQRSTFGDLMQALLAQRARLSDYFIRTLREQVDAELTRREPKGLPQPAKRMSLALVDEEEVAMDVELSHSADNNLDGQRGHVNEWQAMLRMRYNLLAGGGDRAQLEARSYQVAQAWDVRINTLRLLSEDLGLAWNALRNAREQKAVAFDYVQYSERVKEAYQKQFSLGDRTLLDLLDNENELFAAQRRLVDLTYTELYSHYRIKAAEGELLQSLGVVPPMEAVALSSPAPRRLRSRRDRCGRAGRPGRRSRRRRARR